MELLRMIILSILSSKSFKLYIKKLYIPNSLILDNNLNELN
ncbi:hypothetical protein UA3_01713 [Enterococcus faecium EnGen0263]|nr:hypothetical protein UA3_01713 [Enterococcus faecium EnGen0263]